MRYRLGYLLVSIHVQTLQHYRHSGSHKAGVQGHARRERYPDSMARVVHAVLGGERELSMMRWGFPPPPNLGRAPVTNVRNLKSPYWRGWLKAEWRCLVPANSFCEWSD